MTIAVHISFTGSQNIPRTNFNYNCFTVLAKANPADHFIFIFDKPFDASIVTNNNITPVLLLPQIKNRLLQHYWYNYKVPALLKKYGADVFITADGVSSLRAKTPQFMSLHNGSFFQKLHSHQSSDSRYLKRYFRAFLEKSNHVIVSNGYIMDTLEAYHPEVRKKSSIIHMGFHPGKELYTDDRKTETKEKLTAGKEYFLYYVTKATNVNVIIMLKAFSLFKKWQKSNMKLVMLCLSPQEVFLKDLATYKYREDVKIINYNKETDPEMFIAAAYATVYLPSIETLEPRVFESINNNVPVITIDNKFFRSVFKNSVYYCAGSEKDISDKMMMVYKDENVRNHIVIRGQELLAEYTWEKAAGLLWQKIQATTTIPTTFN